MKSSRRRQQNVNVVRHNDKFMQQIFPLLAIVEHRVNQQLCPRVVTKNRSSLPGDGSDKERALAIHASDRSVVARTSIVMAVTQRKCLFSEWERVGMSRTHNKQ